MKKGDIVHIVFLDHASYSGMEEKGALEIECFGRIHAVTKHTYELVAWTPLTEEHEHNAECYSIVRSTIKKIKRLK
jgi:hypothetical protein